MDNKFIPKKVWVTPHGSSKNRPNPLIWLKKSFG